MRKNDSFNMDAAEYEQWFRENDRLLESELDAIRPFIPQSGKGIEIGVGTGIFASRLGISDGVEPSEDMAAWALKRKINIFKGKAEDIPVHDGAYQYALMVTADCFIGDIKKAFLEIRRILDEKGIFIVAFLDKATPNGEIYQKKKRMDSGYKNARFHSSAEMTALLSGAGFKILQRRQTIFSLENIYQKSKDGSGEGLFAVIKAARM